MANQSGRKWRSTQDVATGVALFASSPYWRNWLRDSSDYYYEGVLLWLDIDALIRQKSHGHRSLDDFCRAFFAQRDGPYLIPVPYAIDDVILALNDVLHYDWASFLRERVQEASPTANSDGINRGGYRFFYANSPSWLQKSEAGKLDAVWYSLGVRIDSVGLVSDIRRFGPCDSAKLAPSQIITHVAGQVFSLDVLLKYIAQADSHDRPIVVTLKQGDEVWDCGILYWGGLCYPALERNSESANILADILAPRCN